MPPRARQVAGPGPPARRGRGRPMRWLVAAVAVAAVVGASLLVLLPDGSEAPVRPAAADREHARYDVLDGSGAAVGSVAVDLAFVGDRLEATASVGDAAPAPPRLTYDAATGLLQEVRWTDHSRYPWGPRAHLPGALFEPRAALGGALLAHPEDLVPLGPQWSLLADGSGRWSGPWGEIRVEAAATHAGWTVEAAPACPGCEGVLLRMAGDGGGLLPTRADFAGVNGSFSLVARERSHGAAHAGPFAAAPAPVAVSNPDCGVAPCEAAGLPPRQSLRRGADALQASPEWAAWSQGKSGLFPCLEDVRAAAPLVAAGGAERVQWVFVVGSAQGPYGRFALEETRVPGSPLPSAGPAVVAYDGDYAQQPPCVPHAEHPADAAAALAGLARQAGIALEEVSAVQLQYRQHEGLDPRGELVWLLVGDGAVSTMVGSAWDGRLHEVYRSA